MSRLSLTSVATVVAVLGLLGDNGLSSLGIVGVGARAVPYTTFEERGGRSPWEGERMREVEGLRVRGVSEKEIAAHFSTPHPRTLAYPHPVVARSADPESAPAPVVSAEMKTRFESFLQRMLERIGVKAAEQAADVAGIERKMDGSSVAVGMVVRAEEQREGLEELVEKRGEVEERDATAEMRKQGEVHAREEMKQWLQTRDAEIEGVGAVEERGEEKEARAEGAEGVEMAVVVNSVIAMGEGMAEKRDEEKDEEMPELQVQKRDAEEVVKNALEEWRRGIKERSAGAGEEAGAALEKRSIALDAEDGGLEVRGQMGRLKAVQV
ncbi:hypothetical protein MMC30_001897 [Trapelia coarctata]|nr:hypothetical protein [Trapelia coarctata]